MAVRVLLVLAALGVLYGCGQASSPAERQEKQGGAEEAAPEQATLRCEDFASREAAQEYLDTRATEADKEKIDPDDNGKACDEGAYIFGQQPTTPPSTTYPASATPQGAALSASAKAEYEEADIGDTVELGIYKITVHGVEVRHRYGAYSLKYTTTIENTGQRVADSGLEAVLSNPAGKAWEQDMSYNPPNFRTIPPGRKAKGALLFYFDQEKPAGTYYLDITDPASSDTVSFNGQV